MGKPTDFSDQGFERLPLHTFTEKSYLDYSMYVILDRALPNVGDGLKPVQRRIIFAMSELALHANSKHKKSARTVGDVIGKYHPHGDSACYEAMVLMAQPFSYRYPLVDGQGNWGSEDDPKSFAAMRYTEARLTKFAQVLLAEVKLGTVDWVANFDGTMDEPRILPAKIPVVLLNGTTGIAVGMATDIPPHNLTEVAKACIELLDNPDATLGQLTKHIKGPDYPTDAEIISSKQELTAIYKTGHGSVRMRAKYEIDDEDIIITALPYQTSGGKILEQIAAQMNAKKLPMVEDLRDESDHENPTRLVITPRSKNVNVEELMNHLFATTDLERSYRVNLNMIGTDGKPGVRDLKAILVDWLSFRTETVRRRLQTRLDKILDRLHILEGLHIAFLNIDKVIKIIRTEDEPKPVLMKQFKISDRQAEAILELKLRHLAKLEEMKIRGEQDELTLERDEIDKTLKSKKRMISLIKKEIEEVVEEFGDKRRSRIVQRDAAQAIDPTNLVPAEPITIVLSEKGFVRAGKGYDVDPLSLSYKPGDRYMDFEYTKTNQQAVFMDSTGRTYCLGAHNLPSARGYGDPLTSKLKPPPGATFRGVLTGDEGDLFFVGSDAGYGFMVRYQEMLTRNRAGKGIVSVPKGNTALTPQWIEDSESQWLAMATDDGHLLLLPTAELMEMTKGKGIKLINLPTGKGKADTPRVKAVFVLYDDSELVIHSGNKSKTLAGAELDEYIGERGKRGSKLPRGFQTFDRIEALHVEEEEGEE